MVQKASGTPLTGEFNRQVAIQVDHIGDGDRRTIAKEEELMIVPDDSIISYQVQPEEGDRRIVVRVSINTIMASLSVYVKEKIYITRYVTGASRDVTNW